MVSRLLKIKKSARATHFRIDESPTSQTSVLAYKFLRNMPPDFKRPAPSGFNDFSKSGELPMCISVGCDNFTRVTHPVLCYNGQKIKAI